MIRLGGEDFVNKLEVDKQKQLWFFRARGKLLASRVLAAWRLYAAGVGAAHGSEQAASSLVDARTSARVRSAG